MSDALTLSRADLARLLGVTPPAIGNALDEGAPGVVDRGGPGKPATIEVAPFLAWWIERAVRRGGGIGGKLTDVERGLDIELKREKLARERREYVPRGVLTQVARDAFTRLDVAIGRLESRHAHRLVQLVDHAAAAEALRDLARELRAELRAPTLWEAPLLPDPSDDETASDDVLEDAA